MTKSNAKAYSYSEPIVRPVAGVSSIHKLYAPQTNGEISDSIMQNWTQQAIECYEIDADCTKCSLYAGNYSFICQMPKIVKSLLRAYGKPLIKSDIHSQD